MESILAGIISGSLFYLLVNVPQAYNLRKSEEARIRHGFSHLKSTIHKAYIVIFPFFAFDSAPEYEYEEYVNEFQKTDLLEIFYGDQTRLAELQKVSERIRKETYDLSLNLSLTNKERETLNVILLSDLLNNPIIPSESISVEEGYDVEFPNNQEEIGKSIYALYQLARKM